MLTDLHPYKASGNRGFFILSKEPLNLRNHFYVSYGIEGKIT